MKIFYIRKSDISQNQARQEEMAAQINADEIFYDQASGKDTNRSEFQRMLTFVRKGDVVYTESISRIARNTKDLLATIEILNSKGVGFVSLKENIDSSTPQGTFVLTVFAALAQLERSSMLQRQAEGIAIAKKNGVYKGRKAKQIDEVKFLAMCEEWQNKKRKATSIMREFNITGNTFYRWCKDRNIDLPLQVNQ
jgi:DNA invertase Pin-like site-specific DNA recombinase